MPKDDDHDEDAHLHETDAKEVWGVGAVFAIGIGAGLALTVGGFWLMSVLGG